MNSIAHKLCSIQGRLFELSAQQGFESDEFIKAYMNSEVASKFNSPYDRAQWMGEEYLLDELAQRYQLIKGMTYSTDIMFWMGYTYAYWSIVYGDSCKSIIKMANPKVMAENYAGLHTISVDMAILDLKAQYWSHGKNGEKLRDEVVKKVINDALNSRGDSIDYQILLNDEEIKILDFLRNESSRREYEKQFNQYGQYIERRMHTAYINYILDLIDKADISPKDKAEYSYVVKDIKKSVINRGFSKVQFIFLDSLESRLKTE